MIVNFEAEASEKQIAFVRALYGLARSEREREMIFTILAGIDGEDPLFEPWNVQVMVGDDVITSHKIMLHDLDPDKLGVK